MSLGTDLKAAVPTSENNAWHKTVQSLSSPGAKVSQKVVGKEAPNKNRLSLQKRTIQSLSSPDAKIKSDALGEEVP